MNNNNHFDYLSEFCSVCGSILPPIKSADHLKCYTCHKKYPLNAYCGQVTEYTIQIISDDKYKLENTNKDDGSLGPVVDRKCQRCNNDKMAYATIQLRSADEGQTVFYTCIKCKYKEYENS